MENIFLLSEEHQFECLNETRRKKVFSFFPFIVKDGLKSDFHWTGKWFKWVEIEETKYKERYLFFDDGWTYQHYWGQWREIWFLTKIIK